MASLEEEAYEILDKHCKALNGLTSELQKDLIKLYEEKCTEKENMSQDEFLESSLYALRLLMLARAQSKRIVDPRLN